MAELRRVGGGLEPERRPAGRRVLLPAEAELCNAVGLTEDEYWHFVDLTEAYNGKRPEGYELIPDVRNEPVSVVVSLVIGIALTAVSALLAPKPKQQAQRDDRPGNLQTESITGRQRFTPTSNFNSIQDLAILGSTIPLIYTRNLGVRVNTKLLFSQLLSLGIGQRLQAVFLLGYTGVGRPDFDGLAIGDTLLNVYTNAKLKAYFRNGGRVQKGDAYSEGTLRVSSQNDALAIRDDRTNSNRPYFSGTRTPATQAIFGNYSPMPNGMMFKLEFELVLQYATDIVEDGNIREDARQRGLKIDGQYPRKSAVVRVSGNQVTYRLDASQYPANEYKPWGTEDVREAINRSRVVSDEAISIGEQYLIGDSVYICTSNSAAIWEPGNRVDSVFTRVEGSTKPIEVTSVNSEFRPYARRVIQRVAIGAVTNNRKCDYTEIGIKSTVFKRINGAANYNSIPNESVITRYEEKGGSISIGSLNVYAARMSFFRFQVRRLGSDSWITMQLFAIRGQTPVAQYNYLRVTHSHDQHEFRFLPVAGNNIIKNYLNKSVWLLKPGQRQSISSKGYTVTFSGELVRLSPNFLSNPLWVKGQPPDVTPGIVDKLSRSSNGSVPPTTNGYEFVESKYDIDVGGGDEDDYYKYGVVYWRDDDDWGYIYYWDGEVVRRTEDGRGGESGFGDQNGRYRVGKQRTSKRYEIQRWEQVNKVPKPISTRTGNTTGGSGTGLRVEVKQYSNGASTWRIVSPGRNYKNGQKVRIPFVNQSARVTVNETAALKENENPYDVAADYIAFESDSPSHLNGPEHEIVYVNEFIRQVPTYSGLSVMGLQINSSAEWASFQEFSAYVRSGLPVRRLIDDRGRKQNDGQLIQSTNLFPEIAYDLLTDTGRGAGELIGSQQVDRDAMVRAAKFCRANGFTWNGVITDSVNLREFIFANAGFNLLDFTIIGGRFALVPSVPYSSNFKINQKGKPSIRALFTDGNIRNLKVSFLSPEERQMFRATVLWREEKVNGFAQTRVFTSRLNVSGSSNDPEETFDLTQFCTSQAHAAWFARFALKVRQYVDHSVTFETTPQGAMALTPGDYFQLSSEATHTSRFDNGSIGPDGTIHAKTAVSNNAPIIYWKPGTTGVRSIRIKVSGGRTRQQELWGAVFTQEYTTATKRVYKCESISYADDGLIEVTGSHVDLTSSGTIKYLDWNNGAFIEGTG